MKDDEVIEPSEILVEEPKVHREVVHHINPWIRFLARLTDYALITIAILLVIHFAFPHFTMKKYSFLIPYPYILWIPLEALFLRLWGTTPGKFLLRTKINRKKWDYRSALHRSFNVWFRGMGLGIPVVSFFTMLHAYTQLKLRHTTSWDRDEKTSVVHGPITPIRQGIALAIILTAFVLDRFLNT